MCRYGNVSRVSSLKIGILVGSDVCCYGKVSTRSLPENRHFGCVPKRRLPWVWTRSKLKFFPSGGGRGYVITHVIHSTVVGSVIKIRMWRLSPGCVRPVQSLRVDVRRDLPAASYPGSVICRRRLHILWQKNIKGIREKIHTADKKVYSFISILLS